MIRTRSGCCSLIFSSVLIPLKPGPLEFSYRAIGLVAVVEYGDDGGAL